MCVCVCVCVCVCGLANFRKRYTNVSNTENIISNLKEVLPIPKEAFKVVNVTGSINKLLPQLKRVLQTCIFSVSAQCKVPANNVCSRRFESEGIFTYSKY